MACLSKSVVAVGLVFLGLTPVARSAGTDCVTAKVTDIDAWRTQCDAAIAKETDPVERAALQFRRAYVAVEKYRYDDALKDLNEALAADPDNPLYLHERAYVNGELSEYAAALVDLDRQITLQPNEPTAYRERAHARHFNGDFAGAYEDRDKEVHLTPESPQALLYRGEAALWLARFADAADDAKRAGKLAKPAHNDKVQADADKLLTRIAQWRKVSSHGSAARCTLGEGIDRMAPPTLIGDCTQAFFAAKTGFAQAEALTSRSIAWFVIATDQDSATQDLRIARALDPNNSDRYVNLGYSYLSGRFSWAARREFDRALALERHPYALAGRAAANMNLGDKTRAREDALASQELHENSAAAWVLADLAYNDGDRDAARDLYLDVYRLGSRDDRLFELLKELGAPDPRKAEGQ